MKRVSLLFASLALCSLAVSSCKALPFPDPHLEGAYGDALAKWTRKATIYTGLDTRAFVRVVYLSPEFIKAQGAELSMLRAELPDQAAQTLERLRAETATPTLFAIVYVADKVSNDLESSSSVWRLALNLGLGEMTPISVTRFDRPFDAQLRTLYPYLDEYSVAYQIKFPSPGAPVAPPSSGAQPATLLPPPAPAGFEPSDGDLSMAGALGHLELHWVLDDKAR